MTEETYDVIVIGSGMGGLSCASLLTQMAGKRVLLLERHFKPGGQTHEFKRKGRFAWDVGLHYVGGMGAGEPGRRLMDTLTGGAVGWTPMPDPYDVFIYPGFRFEVPFGEDAYRSRLQTRFPGQAKAIERYFADVHKASHWMTMQMAAKAMGPWMGRMIGFFSGRHEALALQTTKTYLQEHFDDELLRAVLASQWGDYGLSPEESAFGMHALVTSSFYAGAHYPQGGAQTIAKAVLAVVEQTGGQCLVNREAEQLLVENGRVVGVRVRHRHGDHAESETYRAPIVVSDIGAAATYLGLVPEHIPLPFRDQIRSFRHGRSAITAYLGLSRGPEAMGLQGSNYWVFGDLDHDENRRNAAQILEGKPRSVFLSFPSAKDTQAEGHTAEIIGFVDYEAFEAYQGTRWKHRPEEYETLKETIAEGLIEFTDARLPGLRELVEYVEVSTPLSMEHFTGRPFGAFYGVPGVPEKYRQVWCDIETPLPGLYLTGSDVASLGINGAAIGGAMTAGKVLGGRALGKIMSLGRPGT